jgi:hypothetical protein
MAVGLGGLSRLSGLARFSGLTRLARRVARRVSRRLWGLLAGTVVCGRDVGELCLLRSSSGGQANGGGKNSCGSDLHDGFPGL